MSLKQKTISGLTWSFLDTVTGQGISFIIGIIIARILSPREFGLIGMITVFIAISNSLVDSGFSQALIRKQNCTQKDYSTVFIFNVSAGLIFYGLLFVCSEPISNFYKEPILSDLIKVLGLILIINSFAQIQSTIIQKRIDFKLQTKISVLASIISGTVGVFLALTGKGVWSLVIMALSRSAINSIFLWIWQDWKPNLFFSKDSFNELFSFGSKLLVSGLIDTIYRNVYYLIIGKQFTASELGFYTRAEQFKNLPSSNLQGIIGRVSYPVLSGIQDDLTQLKSAYRRLIKSTMLITFVLMLGMAAAAQPLILSVIGEKWKPSVIYLQLLCFVGVLYPLHALAGVTCFCD